MNDLYNSLQAKPYARLLALVFCLVMLSGVALAQGEVPLYRYISQKTGREVYAARKAQVAAMESKMATGSWFRQTVGYVYAEQRSGTIPLYGLTLPVLGSPARVYFTFSDTEYQNLIDGNGSSKKWKPYFSDSAVVAYVLQDNGGNRIGAYYMSSPEPDLRLRFGSKEYNQWKNLPGNSFESGPSFWIWKEKPVPETNFPGTTTQEQTLRQYLYILGKTAAFNMNAPYASAGKQLALSPTDAYECDATGCKFYVAIVISRTVKTDPLYTYAMFMPDGGQKVGNSGTFKKGEGIGHIVVGVKIKFGANSVKVQVQPNQSKDDFNAANNTATFNLFLKKS